MQLLERVPSAGDIVRVRTRLHIVEDVLPAAQSGDGNVIRLRCIDDDALQSQDVVVWEASRPPSLSTSTRFAPSCKRGRNSSAAVTQLQALADE
jgi:hypothetical protein